MKALIARARQSVSSRHLVIYLVAVAAYLPGFWWGAPHATAADRTNAWGVDDEPPMGPLAQLNDIITPGPQPNPNLGYPMMHPFMVMGAYAPYMGWLVATGGLEAPHGEYPFGFTDPVRALRVLTWIAHALSVLLAAGIVVAAYEVGRTLFEERAGLWSAAMVLTMYPMWYYARTSNVDVPVLFFTALAFIPFAKALMHGVTSARGAWFGALAGLALATKEPSFASFIGIPLVLLLVAVPGERRPGLMSTAVWRGAAFAFGAAVVAYAVGSGMVIDPHRFAAHVAFVRERSGDAVAGAVAFMPHYPMTADGHRDLALRIAAYLRDAMTLPGLLLAAVGIAVAVRTARRAAWFSITAITYLLILFWMARAAQLRYVMPAAFTLCIFAGFAMTGAPAWLRRPALALGVFALALGTLRGLDLTWAMLRDSRLEAGAWLRANAVDGDLVEYFGSDQKNPPLEAGIRSGRAIRYLGGNVPPDTGENAVREIIEGWRERAPRFVILTPDHTSRPGEPSAASCPPEIVRRLHDGSLGYVPAARFETPALLPWVRRPQLDYPSVNPPILIFQRAG